MAGAARRLLTISDRGLLVPVCDDAESCRHPRAPRRLSHTRPVPRVVPHGYVQCDQAIAGSRAAVCPNRHDLAIIANLARTAASRAILLTVGAVYATALAFGIEIAEVLLPDKIADSTEVLLCVIGALGGLIVTWRVLRARREGADVSRSR